MDKIFSEMFGNYADGIYKYVGDYFNWEVKEYPDIYTNNEYAEENKKKLVSRCIFDKFQIDNSVFYD